MMKSQKSYRTKFGIMAELVKDLVLVSLGMGIGVVLMCIAQVSKMADEQMEEIKKERIDKE